MSKPEFETLNLTTKNIAKIAELFPGVVAEGKVNFDLLRSILGDDVLGDEAYEFTWVGKRAAIARTIPYKILFVLIYGDEAQAWIEASGTFYNTDWLPLDGFTPKFDGLNLDVVYENLARQIADRRLEMVGDIGEAVNRDKQQQKLERDIVALEKKVERERQFNKQIELNGELKRMRAELWKVSHRGTESTER